MGAGHVLLREITGHTPYCLNYAFAESQFLNNKSILNILDYEDNRPRLKALTGVLNSRLMSFYYKQQAVKSGRNIFPKVVIKDLGCFPVPERLVKCDHPRIVEKVGQLIEAKKMSGEAKTDRDKTYYESKCAALDRQIDRLVYDLYGLTEDEIQIVEKGNE